MSSFRELISSIWHGNGGTKNDTTTANIPESPTVAASPHWSITINKGGDTTATTTTTTTTETSSTTNHDHIPTFTPFIAFCFTLNYVVGTGFLTIPWAFIQSGIVLSSIIMILSAILSDIVKDYLLETMARAEVMLDDDMHWIKNTTTNKIKTIEQYQKIKSHSFSSLSPQITTIQEMNYNLNNNNNNNNTENNPLLTNQMNTNNNDRTMPPQLNAGYHSFTYSSKPSSVVDLTAATTTTATVDYVTPPSTPNARKNFYKRQAMKQLVGQERYMIGDRRKFEVNALCRIFLGKNGLKVYTIVLCMYMCGTLCAYTNVFASAMSEAFPILPNHDNYMYYIGIYSLIVVPMSCMELNEQVTVQVAMTMCRFFMLFFMITTSSNCAGNNTTTDNDNELFDITNSIITVPPPAVNFSGLYKTIPILVMANIYHHSIPGLSHPVIDKTKLGNVIFRSTTACTAIAYTILGITLGYTFGTSISQSANLNWKYCNHNHHHNSIDGSIVETSWYMKCISYFIILFPVLDVLSAFPLNAITLGNNMFGAYYGNQIHEVENNRSLRTSFRLLACIPPLIIGIFVRELGLITDYTGTTGFILGLSIPSLLYIQSTKMAKRKNFVSWTYYTSYGSNTTIASFIIWLGIIMVLIVVASLLFVRK